MSEHLVKDAPGAPADETAPGAGDQNGVEATPQHPDAAAPGDGGLESSSPERERAAAGEPDGAAPAGAEGAELAEPPPEPAGGEGPEPGARADRVAPEPADLRGEAQAADEAEAPDPLAQALAERDEYLDALRRLQADFDNYRKRLARQQAEHLDRATERLVEGLLPVLDTVDLALAHAGDEADQGLTQVAGALMEVLTKEGLERIDALGRPFDPTEHEAVIHEEGDAGHPEVVEVLRAGYRFRGRVLRPAMVKVKG